MGAAGARRRRGDPAPRSCVRRPPRPAGRPGEGRRRPVAHPPPCGVAAPRARRPPGGAAARRCPPPRRPAPPPHGVAAPDHEEPPRPVPRRGGRAGPGVGAPQAVGHRERRRGSRRGVHRVRVPAGDARPRARRVPAGGCAVQGAATRPGGAVVDRPLPLRPAPPRARARTARGRGDRGGERVPRGDGHGVDPVAHRSRRPARAHQLPAGLRPRARLRRDAGRPAARGRREAPARVPPEPQVEPRHPRDERGPARQRPSAGPTCSAASTCTSGRWGRSSGGPAPSSSGAASGTTPVYTYVLREYIDYLVEKRFSLQCYVEGGRSRTGKLLPPRFGLLAYVADAYRRGRSDDVVLVPVSIAYDQLQDVARVRRESRAASKRRESIGWLVRALPRAARPLRPDLRPLRRAALARAGARARRDRRRATPTSDSLPLQKVAFEVSRRINEVTPITATSLVTLSLLGAQGRALTLEQVRAAVHDPAGVRAAARAAAHAAISTSTPTTACGARCEELERHHVVVQLLGRARARCS